MCVNTYILFDSALGSSVLELFKESVGRLWRATKKADY